jgi:Holliday junction resolvasome RuvABC endonuclease subunit
VSTPHLFAQDPAPAAVPAAGPAPRVIGLDLSLTSTGVCLPDGTTYRIKTRATDGDLRLTVIRDRIRDAVLETRPQLAVVEDLPMTANSAGITGMVHGVVREVLAVAGVPRALIVPATLKVYATGHGRADKDRMAAAAYAEAGVQFPADPGGDQCDAWWLRAAGLDWWGTPEFVLPDAQRVRLGKGKWPARELVTR